MALRSASIPDNVFINDSHLPPIPDSEAYCCEAVFREEVEQLFLPGWHCAGTARTVSASCRMNRPASWTGFDFLTMVGSSVTTAMSARSSTRGVQTAAER